MDPDCVKNSYRSTQTHTDSKNNAFDTEAR